jgi:hypothetical protein
MLQKIADTETCFATSLASTLISVSDCTCVPLVGPFAVFRDGANCDQLFQQSRPERHKLIIPPYHVWSYWRDGHCRQLANSINSFDLLGAPSARILRQ